VRSKESNSSFKRLPYNYCALSLQPFEHPVCTAEGTIFDLTNIISWIEKHGTNPVNGTPLKAGDLIKLNFSKNDDGEFTDPVTYKVFTNNTHIVALKNTGNVFAYDTIERLNIKPKMWRDLISNEEFSRRDIIVLQDPQNLESRNISSFKYHQDGTSTLTEDQERERNESNINKSALGNAARVLKAKEAVAQARAKRDSTNPNHNPSLPAKSGSTKTPVSKQTSSSKALPYNAAQYTTGKAAASFTSTGVSVHTGAERALLTDEEYMLQPKRVKQKGYARITTSYGDLNIELRPEFAPHAVWNFIQLAKKGYYNGVLFHRNIRNFMIQGGDPTGTGKGGQSIWGKTFNDEFDGPLKHDTRGVVSMANKGKNTNSSQFFILYRAAKHLDRKHTIFGQVVGGLDVLSKLEEVPVSENDNRPLDDVEMKEVVIFVDPFEEFQKAKRQKDDAEAEAAQIAKQGGTEDDLTTWTGKRIRADGTIDDTSGVEGVGKYLKKAAAAISQAPQESQEDEIVEEWIEDDIHREPARKRIKASGGGGGGGGGGFGNFDSW
jgi:peptidyl-prolyl cis-trans isomerase-like 2